MSDVARELLRELLEEALAANGNGHAPGGDRGGAAGRGAAAGGGEPGGANTSGAPPPVPAPPVAAVLRPSTWVAPPAPGEVIGGGARDARARVEPVRLASDADLARFVADVLANADAIRAGALRFTLGAAPASGVRRVERGAVTERTVNDAAKQGQKLVLGAGAVLTPLARERARALKIEIERER